MTVKDITTEEKFSDFCDFIKDRSMSIVFCERFNGSSEIWNFNRHKHDFIELLYFLYGDAEVMLDDEKLEASFYDVIVYPEGMYHTEHLQFDKYQEIICIGVKISGLQLDNIIHFQDVDIRLKWLLENIHKEKKSEVPCEELVACYVKAAVLIIAKRYFENERYVDDIGRIIQYMYDNIADDITVEDIAELLHVSKSYVSRKFKKSTGMTLIEYLRMLRVKMAMTLLVSTNRSVEDIAFTVGYNSSKYFYTAFKKCAGCSPSEYRMSQGKN